MPKVADETAYYLNRTTPVVALIAKGCGSPMAYGSASPTPQHWLGRWKDLLRDMFPALKGTGVTFATLMTEFGVKEFEAGAYQTG